MIEIAPDMVKVNVVALGILHLLGVGGIDAVARALNKALQPLCGAQGAAVRGKKGLPPAAKARSDLLEVGQARGDIGLAENPRDC